MTTTETDTDRAEGQAQAQLDSIGEMVKAMEAGEEYEGQDASEAISEDALDVQVRTDWHTPGDSDVEMEYLILLCTGGPACRIIGELDEHGQPTTAKMQYQDWGTPWATLQTSGNEDDAMLSYAGQFYFGE